MWEVCLLMQVIVEIKQNGPKYVITTDNFDFSQDGIIHNNIMVWLLEDK